MRPISNDDSERVSIDELVEGKDRLFSDFGYFATSIGYIIPLCGENASAKFLSKKIFEVAAT